MDGFDAVLVWSGGSVRRSVRTDEAGPSPVGAAAGGQLAVLLLVGSLDGVSAAGGYGGVVAVRGGDLPQEICRGAAFGVDSALVERNCRDTQWRILGCTPPWVPR